MRGKTLAEAAAQEAYEEAGVSGIVESRPIGRFKQRKRRFFVSFEVDVLVHPLAVSEELEVWPEQGQRTRGWFDVGTAVTLVQSRELGRLITELDKQDRVRAR